MGAWGVTERIEGWGRGVAGSGARASSPKEEFGGRGPGRTIADRGDICGEFCLGVMTFGRLLKFRYTGVQGGKHLSISMDERKTQWSMDETNGRASAHPSPVTVSRSVRLF